MNGKHWERDREGEERARIESIMIGKRAKMEIENENCITTTTTAIIIIANLTHHNLSRIHISSL